jgi:hypothetical protein
MLQLAVGVLHQHHRRHPVVVVQKAYGKLQLTNTVGVASKHTSADTSPVADHGGYTCANGGVHHVEPALCCYWFFVAVLQDKLAAAVAKALYES